MQLKYLKKNLKNLALLNSGEMFPSWFHSSYWILLPKCMKQTLKRGWSITTDSWAPLAMESGRAYGARTRRHSSTVRSWPGRLCLHGTSSATRQPLMSGTFWLHGVLQWEGVEMRRPSLFVSFSFKVTEHTDTLPHWSGYLAQKN